MRIEDITPQVLEEAKVQVEGANEFVEIGVTEVAKASEAMFGTTATSLALMSTGAALIGSSVDLLYADIRKHMAKHPESPGRQILDDDVTELRRKLNLVLDGVIAGKSIREVVAETMIGSAFTAPAAHE